MIPRLALGKRLGRGRPWTEDARSRGASQWLPG